MLRWGKTMFDSEFGAELVELVPAGGASFAQAEQAIGEFLAIVGENYADAYRAGPFQIARDKRRALAAVLDLQTRTNTQRVARSIATNR